MITRSRRLHRSRPPITHATTSCQWGRLGRLTRFAMSPGTGSSETSYTGYSQTYGFDANNNRTASTELRTTPQGSLNTLQGWTLQSSSNRLNQRSELSTLDGAIQTSRTDRYTLDAAGNQSDDGWQRFQYDALNRLGRSIGTSHSVLYLHNALGQRTFKSGPKPESLNTPVGSLSEWIGQWVPWAKGAAIANNLQRQGTAFMYDEAGQLLGEYVHDGSNPNSQGGEYIWLPRPDGGSELVGYVKSQGSQTQRYAVHSDHLGTPRRISNESGQPVWQWAYSAYGDNAAQVLAAAPPGFEFNPRFPGQSFDSESGKHYNYFRTYDPQTGRYTSADPIGLGGGWNRFVYVGGNPVSFVDPDGLQYAGSVPLGGLGSGLAGSVARPNAGTLVDPIVIPNTGVETSCPPKPGNQDPCKGYRKDLEEHRKKLQEYLNDPLPMDNKNHLKNAIESGNMNLFWIIRATRIRSILFQINLKEKQLRKCEEMYGMS